MDTYLSCSTTTHVPISSLVPRLSRVAITLWMTLWIGPTAGAWWSSFVQHCDWRKWRCGQTAETWPSLRTGAPVIGAPTTIVTVHACPPDFGVWKDSRAWWNSGTQCITCYYLLKFTMASMVWCRELAFIWGGEEQGFWGCEVASVKVPPSLRDVWILKWRLLVTNFQFP